MKTSVKNLNFSHKVYSPRWGHADIYNVAFCEDKIHISNGAHYVDCVLSENGNPEWSGSKDSFVDLLENDHIYPPTVVDLAVESAWAKWLDGNSDEVVISGLNELFDWIDQTSRSKPSGDLWDGIF